MQNRSINSWSVLGPVMSARHLLGRPVRNLQNEKLGHVKNLMVDLAAGRIAGVILTSGGFLGVGADFSSAPVMAFQYDSARNLLQLDATPEMLYLSPAYTESAWQNFPLSGYLAGQYYPYRIVPFNNTDSPGGAEHSGSVTRADDSRGLPALTQSSNQADQDVQARIRSALQNDSRLSQNARNVLIITQNGLVTLRGPVNTSDEKQLIGQIARQIAPGEQVDNELEVQLTTAN
jgi:sporulation protein YlmC with PRC-barrel domain